MSHFQLINPWRRGLSIFIFLICSALLLHLSDLDDRMGYWLIDWQVPDAHKQQMVWLPHYAADVAEVPISGVEKNLSGITYNFDSGNLWVVTNNPQQLIELSKDFEPIRRINLKNFRDTEAVAYLGGDKYVIGDERDFSVSIATINESTRSLDRADLPRVSLDHGGDSNLGLEGLAVDTVSSVIYLVKEKRPLQLITLSGLHDRKQIDISSPEGINLGGLSLDDLSGLHLDGNTGNFLVLSDESKLLAEVDRRGNKVSHMDLESGFSGLNADVPQAEGVAMDSAGHIYIVSEPNLIYRFSKI